MNLSSIFLTLLLCGPGGAFMVTESWCRTQTALFADVVVVENPRKTGLALQLDDGTRKSHSIAENTEFVSGFFAGLANEASFRNLVTSLFYVYQAMETAFDESSDDSVKKLDDKELRRMKPLEEDMEYFYGSDWKSKLPPPTPATVAYVERIQRVAEEEPYLLVAHQYTRYLGDLFGGQMMGGMATKSLGLPSGKGVAFYKFDDIDSVTDYITDWYTRLNQLELSDEAKDRIVDEANLVFALNIGILQELEGSPLQAMWSLMVKTVQEKLGLV